MKRTLIAAAGFALATACGLASAASWSVIVQPGVYGRVAIGGYAEPPRVYTPQPVIAVDDGYGQVVEELVDPAYATDQPPVYLWVPDYQRQHWAQYCREYGAYGVPVYFVDDGWYRANVLRRNWTPEQRSWSQQQWLEQDRLARDRFERQRFEQQRQEQQQRWNNERAWHDEQQRRQEDPARQAQQARPVEDGRSQQSRWERERAEQQDAQNRMRWGSARGFIGQGQASQPPPSQQQSQQQAQANPAPRGQQGGAAWQAGAGQWQQGGAAGRQGNAGQPAASQPRGAGNGNAATQAPNSGERRGEERSERRTDESRRGREGNRDR